MRALCAVCAGVLVVACGASESEEADDGGVEVIWAGLASEGTCLDTGFGDGQFPPGAQRVVVRMEGDTMGDPVVGGFDVATTELLGRGLLLVPPPPDLVPPGTPFDLRVEVCRADPSLPPLWSGRTNAVVLTQHEKTAVHMLLTPEDDPVAGDAELACPTPDVLVGTRRVGHDGPVERTAFPTATTLATGDVLLTGGVAVRAGRLEASQQISVLHRTTATFLHPPGQLRQPRAMASALAISDTRALVYGGTTAVVVDANPSTPYIHPGADAAPWLPETWGEIVDAESGAAEAWAVSGAEAANIETLPLMASTLHDTAADVMHIVGGYGATDAGFVPDITAARIAGVTSASPTLTARELAQPRVGAALLLAPSGDVVVYGGNTSGDPAQLVEWISADGTAGGPVARDGPEDLPVPAYAQAMEVFRDADRSSWLVLGGMPASPCTDPCDPSREGQFATAIEEDLSVLVHVISGPGAPEVRVEPLGLALAAPDLGRRAFAQTLRLANLQAGVARWLIGGGIAGLTKVTGLATCAGAATDQCLRDDIVMFAFGINIDVDGDGVGDGPSIRVEHSRRIGTAAGATFAARSDGTVVLSSTFSALAGSPSIASGPRLWNPLLPSEHALCEQTK